jgi:U3 small nucleolar RNA-associated protein 22
VVYPHKHTHGVACVQAAAFRAFWGERSQLRRFADRSIVETVVWPAPARGRGALIGDILTFVLRRHMRLGDASVCVPSLDVEALLPPPRAAAAVADAAAGAPATVLANAALERLAGVLTGAAALPLRITAVAPCAPALRYTSVAEPAPHPLAGGDVEAAWTGGAREVPRVLRAMDAVVSLERSGKWPGSLAGIAAVKTALLVAMRDALAGAGITARPTAHWLDVLVDGYAFRLTLLVERELAMLREAAGRGRALLPAAMVGRAAAARAGGGGDGELSPGAAAEAAEALERACVRLPLHASLVHAFALSHWSYAGAARLAKAWLAAQMLSDEYCEELVELLVAVRLLLLVLLLLLLLLLPRSVGGRGGASHARARSTATSRASAACPTAQAAASSASCGSCRPLTGRRARCSWT